MTSDKKGPGMIGEVEDLAYSYVVTSDNGPDHTPSEVFAQQLRATRDRKGWSQQRLADRLRELGEPIDRSVIAKIEGGNRPVSVDEAFAFAAALGVPAAALLVPRDGHTSVRVAGIKVTAYVAHRWIRGLSPLTAPEGTFEETTEAQRFFDDARPDFEAVAFERMPVLRQVLGDAWSLVTVASLETDPAQSRLFRMDLDRLARGLNEIALRIDEQATKGS